LKYEFKSTKRKKNPDASGEKRLLKYDGTVGAAGGIYSDKNKKTTPISQGGGFINLF